MARIPMDWKELREGRRVGIPEHIISRMAQGLELDVLDKSVVKSHGKVYVEAHKKNSKWIKPHLRDLSGGKRIISNRNNDDKDKIKMILTDAFNNPYEVNAYTEEKLRELLGEIDIDEVVEEAYKSYVPGFCDGVAYLNIETGEIESAGLSTGTGIISSSHLIGVYTVKQNLDLPTEDLFDEDEMDKANEVYGGDYSEYIKKENID